MKRHNYEPLHSLAGLQVLELSDQQRPDNRGTTGYIDTYTLRLFHWKERVKEFDFFIEITVIGKSCRLHNNVDSMVAVGRVIIFNGDFMVKLIWRLKCLVI